MILYIGGLKIRLRRFFIILENLLKRKNINERHGGYHR
jgi:hypothetical protein